MKLQHLSAFTFLAVSLASLACSAPDDEIFMGNDNSGGSGGSSAGTQEPGSGGKASGGKSQGGTQSGGTESGGTESGGAESGGSGGSGGSASGGTGPAPWDPCAGKACGDFCQACDPKDANCVALAVEMTCTATGQCSIGRPACTIPECEGTQQYYAPGCDSLRPAAGGVFVAGCYDSCSGVGACADGYTCTPVWHDPSANCPPGEACIGACGAQATLCIQN